MFVPFVFVFPLVPLRPPTYLILSSVLLDPSLLAGGLGGDRHIVYKDMSDVHEGVGALKACAMWAGKPESWPRAFIWSCRQRESRPVHAFMVRRVHPRCATMILNNGVRRGTYCSVLYKCFFQYRGLLDLSQPRTAADSSRQAG